MSPNASADRKAAIPRLLFSAFALLLTTGASQEPADPLANVNPELRQVAAAILHPAKGSAPYVPPKPRALPDGVIERPLAPRDGQPPVTVYVVNASADGEESKISRGAILYIHGGGFVAGDTRR